MSRLSINSGADSDSNWRAFLTEFVMERDPANRKFIKNPNKESFGSTLISSIMVMLIFTTFAVSLLYSFFYLIFLPIFILLYIRIISIWNNKTKKQETHEKRVEQITFAGKITCSFCKSLIEKEAVFCTHCGK